jgi:ATPase subunit of ABC transporter with duplicated ATPase domains
VILLEKVTKRFGPKILFENVSMQFDPGKRYGLTGANGAGKSTLLKMLSADEDTDTGSIAVPGNLRLGVLKQNHFAYDEHRIIDTVMMGNKALWDAMTEKDHLLAGEVTDEVGIRLGELEGVIAEENGYVAESEAGALLEGLGIAAEKHPHKMTTLPAGYKLRVLIAQVLFGKSDVLLLDEPTNHLDLDSIRWLEHFLIEEFRGTLVCVSHDRHFLNAVATHIADIDYRTITIYTGGYDDFVAQKYENKQRAEQQTAAAKKKIDELQDFVSRFGAHKSKSSQAQSRLKQIEKLEEQIEQRGPKKSSLVRPFIRFEFDKPSGRDVLRVAALKKSYGKLVVFDGASLNVNRSDKIAVTGPNGVGKSTLLKCIVGSFPGIDADTKKETLTPEAGEIDWGHDVSVGYFAQDHHESLGAHAGEQNAFEWLYQFDKKAEQERIRGIMGRLLFSGEAALKPVSALSGGELARLLLCKLLLQKHNVLVLDEPTNHLDIESIEGLLDGLRLFKGTVIVTSHDRHFVSEVATRVMELHKVDARTEISDFGGTYEEFLERKKS